MGDREYLRHDWEGAPGPRTSFFATHGMTKWILIVLAGIHLFLMILRAAAPAMWQDVFLLFALNPQDVIQKFYVWQLVTGALLHSPVSIFHLLFNCLSIWFFGRMVEDRLGKKRYLRFCITAAVCASFGYLVFAVLGSSVQPMVGASGAAMGILLLVALWTPRLKVIFIIFPMEIWILVSILIGLDLIGILSVDSSIAHAAHLAGALYGWVYFRWGRRIEGVFGAIDEFADKREREKARKNERERADLRAEVDRILDKVNREGMTALTDTEKRTLKDASKRLR